RGIEFKPSRERDSEPRAATQFCDEVLPRVLTRVGRTKLLIGCRSLFPLAKRLPPLPGGEVPAPMNRLRGLFRRGTVAVAPKRLGAETERGLLEAMGAGVPIITTADGLSGL